MKVDVCDGGLDFRATTITDSLHIVFRYNVWYCQFYCRIKTLEVISSVTALAYKKLLGLAFTCKTQAIDTSDAIGTAPVRFSKT
jgi:hypothetical protein